MKNGDKGGFQIRKRGGTDGGVSFQLPKGWDDGSGKIKHIKGGPHDGRVYFSSRHEAKEIAKRLQDKEERHVRYDD
jgi:hypothetical protein